MWKRSHPDKAKEKMNLGLCVMTCVPIAWIAFVFSFTQPTLYPCKSKLSFYILVLNISPISHQTYMKPIYCQIKSLFVPSGGLYVTTSDAQASYFLIIVFSLRLTMPHCRIDQHQKFVTSSLWIASTSSMQLRVFSGLHPTHAQTIHEIEVGDNL